MAMTDPIADMLTRIRNGGIAKHAKVDIPLSKVKVAIANVLKETGFVKNYKVISEDAQGVLRVYLKYDVNNLHVINEIKRISKPGRRTYVSKEDIPQVKNGFGCAILTTCKGVISDAQARQDGVGGEIICTVW